MREQLSHCVDLSRFAPTLSSASISALEASAIGPSFIPSSRKMRTASGIDGLRLPLTISLAYDRLTPRETRRLFNDGSSMSARFANHEQDCKRKVRTPANDMIFDASHYANMKKSKTKKDVSQGVHYLREWREFRKMTQDELAAAVKTSKSVISEKESSKRGLSNKWLERLAPALKVQKGWLLERNPADIGADLLEIWGEIPAKERPRVLAILETFRKTGTEN